MLSSLRSFPLFAKERCVLCVLFRSLAKNGTFFGSHKSPKTREKNGKEGNVPNGKEWRAQPWVVSNQKCTVRLPVFPDELRTQVEIRTGLSTCSFQKNVPIFAFFSVLYKRTEWSLPSFLFFIKEENDLCVLFCSL